MGAATGVRAGWKLTPLLWATGETPSIRDPMASWKSPCWLLMWMVFTHSALLQVIGRGEEREADTCLLRSVIPDHLRCAIVTVNPMPKRICFCLLPPAKGISGCFSCKDGPVA